MSEPLTPDEWASWVLLGGASGLPMPTPLKALANRISQAIRMALDVQRMTHDAMDREWKTKGKEST